MCIELASSQYTYINNTSTMSGWGYAYLSLKQNLKCTTTHDHNDPEMI